MSNRFHNKFHSHNHHTKPTDRDGLYPDSAYDPIASREAPFKGEFYTEDDITAAGSLSARYQVTGQTGLFHGDVTVKGNLEVLGTTTQLDTLVYATSAFQIENHGTGPALKVTQFGQQPLAHFIDFEGDDVILDNSGFLGLGTDSPNKKLTVVGDISATRHTDSATYGYGHIFNDGNTTTQGRLTVVNQTHLLSSAFISNNLTVNTRTLFVSAGPSGRGRVGINTEVPSEELTVDGDGLINENLTVGIDLNVLRDTKITRNLYVNTKGLVSLSGVDGNSKIGINTLTPNVELSIKGSLSATGNATLNGGLTADGNLYTKGSGKIDGQTTFGTVNATTNPDTNVKVLVHDSDSVVRFNYPNDVIWDTAAEFLTAKNLTTNTLPLYKSKYTLENSPISLSGTTISIAANLSANGNLTTTGTFKSNGNLTAANVFGTIIYSDDSNSREWKSVYTTMRNTSATWEEAAAQAGSGGAFNTIKAVSGTWDQTYTIVKQNSATWNDLADGVVFRTGSNMTGPLTINPQGENYNTTALSLTGDINLKGTIVIDTNAVAPVMSLSNPNGYGRLEVGGLSGGYIDFKSPFTDDFDIRVAHDRGTSYIATSGDLYLKTGTQLESLVDRAVFKSDGKVGVRTGNPTAYLHVSGSTAVIDTTPIAILGGVEITTSNGGTSYSGGTRADVSLDIGKIRNVENVGMATLNFWSQNGIQDASIERRPVISGGVTTGDATNGDFRITNFGAGVLYVDAGAGSDSGIMQLWAGQGNTSNPGINSARTGVILSGGFIGFRNEYSLQRGTSGSEIRLSTTNNPTLAVPISSGLVFQNSANITDAEIENIRSVDGSTSLLFRTTTAGLSTSNRTSTAMTIRGGFVGVNKVNPFAPLDVSGGIISTSGAVRAQQGQPTPNTTTQNAAGYAFVDAANTGLFATNANSVSLYAVGSPVVTLENTGTRKIIIGGGETSDASGNVYIGTTTWGAGESGYGRRHLVVKSSGATGGLLELADSSGGHGLIYRSGSGTASVSSAGGLIIDSRMNDSYVNLVSRGIGNIGFYTGGRVAFPGQSQINDYLTMSVNHQQVNINGGLFATPIGLSQRVKPAGWGGGVTTFDLYSDGGSIGIGAAGTGVPLAFITNAGLGSFTGLQVNGNINATGTITANGGTVALTNISTGTVNARELIVETPVAGSAGRIEVGGPLGGYIDLKSPSTNDSNFRIAHWNSPTNGISNSLECQGPFYLYTGVQMFNMNPRMIVTRNLGRIGIGENSAPWMKMAIMGGLELFGETWNTNQPLSGRFVKPANSNVVTITYPNHGVAIGQTTSIEAREVIYDYNLVSPVNTLANVTGIQESNQNNNWVAFTATADTANTLQYTDSAATASTVMSGDIIFLRDEGNSVDRSNRTQTYINFKAAESVNDFALLRQIGGSNQYHLALDMYDDPATGSSGSGQTFSIRNIQSAGTIPNINTTMFTVGTNTGAVRAGINLTTPADTLDVGGTTSLRGNVFVNKSGTDYGTLFVGRQDAGNEGGQIQFAEANNNTAYWYMDVFDATNPRFRIFTPVGPNPGEVINITNTRQVGIQRMPDAGITLDVNGIIRGTQVYANSTGGQVYLNLDPTYANIEAAGARGAYIDLRQLGATSAAADSDYSLRLRAYDNGNDIDSPYRNLTIRANSFGVTNESRITLGSGNKVGIGQGVNAPAAVLHVGGDIIGTSLRNNNTATALELYSGTTASKRASLSLNGSGTLNTDGVTVTTGVGITSLTVDNTGKTALGYGGNALTRLHIARASNGTNFDNHIFLQGTINDTYGWFIDTHDYTGEIVPFRISARRNGGNTNHFLITNVEGNVGIGNSFTTLAPSARLHIRGGTSDQIKLSHTNRGVIFRNDNSDFYLLHTAADDPNGTWNSNRPFSFNFGTGIVALAYSGSTQCIVGSATPLYGKTYKFQVNGDIYANNWLRTEGNNGWYSETYGGGWHMTDTTWIRAYNNKSVMANQFFATGGEVFIETESPYGRLEIGGSFGGYIDLKSPASDGQDFKIAHWGNGNNTLECKGDLNIWTGPADGNSVVHRVQFSRDGQVYIKGSEGAIGTNTVGAGSRIEVQSAGTGNSGNAAYIAFHRPSSLAVKFGLDTDNELKVGGWSYGNNAYRIVHEGLSETNLNTISFKKTKETKTSVSVSSGVVNLDMNSSSVFELNNPTATVSSFAILNFPSNCTSFTLIIVQGSTPRTVTWSFGAGKTIKWPDSEAPVVTPTANKTDIFTFSTFDGGTTWFGGTVGQNY